MTQWLRRTSLAALLVLVAASAALADQAKLDPLARIALQRLRGGESAQSIIAEGRFSVSAVGELDVFVVGDVTREQLEAAGARVRTALPGVFTAYVPADRIEEVAALGGVQRIEGAAIDEVTNDVGTAVTGGATFRGGGPAFTGLNGAGVIVANIDTGVDYDHDDFKTAGGQTRILRIWDQINAVGPPPAGFPYGTEWTQAQIDALLSNAGDTNGHGSHTMGTIAGDGSATAAGSAPAFTYAGMAPMADIIVVDGSSAGTFSRAQMLDGVNYVFQQATAFGKPAVVNVSIGSQFGPKDGTDTFELGIDALSGPGKVVVMSAGNDRGTAVHSEVFAAGAGTSTTVSIAGSGTNRRIVFNGYYEASENLNVRVTTPGGTVIGPVPLGAISGAFPGPATPNGTVYVENGAFLTSTGDRQVYIDLAWAASNAGVGTWTFTFIPVALGAANGEVDLWRVSVSTGSTANFVIGNQPNEEIISAIATSPNSIAAGAWVSRQSWLDCSGLSVGFSQPAAGNIATFSSPGPTRDGRIKPDVAGPGSGILSTRTGDVVATCTAGGDVDLAGLKHAANQGTSMSAPHVTGAVALLFQKYGLLTPAQVQTQLHNRAIVDDFVTAFGAAPNKDFGWGKLNIGDMTNPSCTVTSPNGGEVLDVGDPVNLTWNASDPFIGVTGVDLAISRDNGSNWTNIATGIANTGSFAWNVTGPVTTAALLRATASDAAANQGVDVSNAVWEIQDPVTAVGDQDIVEFALARVSPNPISDQAVIEYSVPRASEVSVLLYDLQGREVAQLARGRHEPGVHQVTWSGEVDGGRAHAGVYFLQLKGPGVAKTQRLVVAR